jgi:glycosyltransferase involved in cell wall biosynthesis
MRSLRQKRLALDATFVRHGRVGGAEQMAQNLVAGLLEAGADVEVLARKGEWPPGLGLNVFEAPAAMNRFAAGAYAALVRRGRYDALIGANYFVPPFVTAGRASCGVIHDLQYVHYPAFFSARKRRWLRAAHGTTLRVADLVVVISESARDDLFRVHGSRHAEKVVVIPDPVSWERFDSAPDDVPPPFPYVLAVAAQYPHKNLVTLVRAFDRLKVDGALPELRLVLVGQESRQLVSVTGADSLARAVENSRFSDHIIRTGFVEDAALARWYRHASVFAFPSLFEGFGMPAVEALGLGVPTITTRCAALPESTLGLAHYVDDPTDDGELASLLKTVLENRDTHAPVPADVARIRSTYEPQRIGRLYIDAIDRI